MDDVKLAAQLLKCKTSDVERVERDAAGGLRVWHHGTYKYYSAERLKTLAAIDLSDGVDDAEAALASHALRARMVPPESSAAAPVKKSRSRQ